MERFLRFRRVVVAALACAGLLLGCGPSEPDAAAVARLTHACARNLGATLTRADADCLEQLLTAVARLTPETRQEIPADVQVRISRPELFKLRLVLARYHIGRGATDEAQEVLRPLVDAPDHVDVYAPSYVDVDAPDLIDIEDSVELVSLMAQAGGGYAAARAAEDLWLDAAVTFGIDSEQSKRIGEWYLELTGASASAAGDPAPTKGHGLRAAALLALAALKAEQYDVAASYYERIIDACTAELRSYPGMGTPCSEAGLVIGHALHVLILVSPAHAQRMLQFAEAKNVRLVGYENYLKTYPDAASLPAELLSAIENGTAERSLIALAAQSKPVSKDDWKRILDVVLRTPMQRLASASRQGDSTQMFAAAATLELAASQLEHLTFDKDVSLLRPEDHRNPPPTQAERQLVDRMAVASRNLSGAIATISTPAAQVRVAAWMARLRDVKLTRPEDIAEWAWQEALSDINSIEDGMRDAAVFAAAAHDTPQRVVEKLARAIADAEGTGGPGVTLGQATMELGGIRSRSILPEQIYEHATTRAVLYATSRAPVPSSKRPLIPGTEFGTQRARGLSYGAASVSIPKNRRSEYPGVDDTWDIVTLNYAFDPKRDISVVSTKREDARAFFASVRDIGAADRSRIIVYVHGFGTTFAGALRRAGQLTHDMRLQGAVIAYSWPSNGSVTMYGPDYRAMDVEIASGHFVEFLNRLRTEVGASKISIIAHSMGSRLVTAALTDLAERRIGTVAAGGKQPQPFMNAIFAAADIGKIEFRAGIDRWRPLVDRATLYASSRDLALNAADDFMHWDGRAGDATTLLVSPGLDSIDATRAETADPWFRHGYFAEGALPDIAALVQFDAKPHRRCVLGGRKWQTYDIWTFGQGNCSPHTLMDAIARVAEAGGDGARALVKLRADIAGVGDRQKADRLREIEKALIGLLATESQ